MHDLAYIKELFKNINGTPFYLQEQIIYKIDTFIAFNNLGLL